MEKENQLQSPLSDYIPQSSNFNSCKKVEEFAKLAKFFANSNLNFQDQINAELAKIGSGMHVEIEDERITIWKS